MTAKTKRRVAKKRAGLRPREERLLERWESAVEDLRDRIQQSARLRNPTPSEKPDAIIKTEVYRTITNLVRSERAIDLEVVLAHKIEGSPRVKFKANPYFWGLKAVARDQEVALNENVVSKFATELLYASRHEVPPEVLTGFIYQVGGIRGVRLKLSRDEMESWYRPDLPWLWTRST